MPRNLTRPAKPSYEPGFPGWNKLSDAEIIVYSEKMAERERERKERTELKERERQQREQVEYEKRIEEEQKSRSLSYVIIKNNDMLQLSTEVNQYIGNMYEPIGNVCVDSGMFYQTVYKKEIFGGKNRTRRQRA